MDKETEDMAIEQTETTPEGVGADAPEKEKTDWIGEAKSILLLLMAVLAFHSLVAKPFYIPSVSMMPGLLVGDRLIVSKYAYGWSWVSPTFHVLPKFEGRLFGEMPERGDVVILTPPDERTSEDWIKRVIGLPGDTVEMRGGQIFINDKPVKQDIQPDLDIPVDTNTPCGDGEFPGLRNISAGGGMVCTVPVVRETLPNGVSYDVIDLGYRYDVDDVDPVKVPAGHVYLMGDNRDRSADSRVPAAQDGLGGAVPWENIGGRAEFVTFSLDGTTTINPLTWFGAFRSGRAGTSLRPEKTETASAE